MARKPAAAAGTIDLTTDLSVNRMGFGAMRVTGPGIWGEPNDRAEAVRVVRRAVELGVNFIDTADAYGPEVSENIIAEAIFPYDDVVIATKGGQLRDGPGKWKPDCRPEHLRAACEGSLKRLRVDRIDLYQLHTVDPRVPIEESVGALAELQAAGKIAHVGLSNVDVGELARAERIVEIVSVQNRYNLADRASEKVLDACEDNDIAFIPWWPLATGNLAEEGSPLQRIADRREATPAQIALAWLLARSPVVTPIPGTSSVAHLEENIEAATIQLNADEIEDIEQATNN